MQKNEVRLVCYADENMTISQNRCIESAYKHGITNHHAWSREMIQQTEFYELNREILDTPRGSGLWAWKSFIIYKALLDMSEDDILCYADVGVEFINDVNHIISRMDEDIFLFGNNYSHVEWCKGDVLAIILPITNHENYGFKYVDYTVRQVQASVIFIRVSQFAKDFIKEWLMYCQVPGLIDDSPSKVPNYPTFAENRHDQALLTCLQIKYGLKLHYWPASYNNGAFFYDRLEQYQDTYPAIFNHHRKRNNEY